MTEITIAYDIVSQEDVADAFGIESESYPADEAATLEALMSVIFIKFLGPCHDKKLLLNSADRYRQNHAGDLFLGAFIQNDSSSRSLIGYICSTASSAESLSHASMLAHDSTNSAHSVCIHSVCVAKEYRRKGIALGLLHEYSSRLTTLREGQYHRLLLISHEELISLYEKAGFELVGKSNVTHGARPWFEMRKTLRSVQDTPSAPQVIPPGVFEALQRAPRSRPEGALLSAFPNGILDVQQESSTAGQTANKYDLLCPRDGCGSVLLLKQAAQWVERAAAPIDPPSLAPSPILPPIPTAPATSQWWLITPSPMAFENIGFSRPVDALVSASGKKLKLLACSECDLGPLGWCEEGGKEFWLAGERVRYRS